jgi:hypothetical protein
MAKLAAFRINCVRLECLIVGGLQNGGFSIWAHVPLFAGILLASNRERVRVAMAAFSIAA